MGITVCTRMKQGTTKPILRETTQQTLTSKAPRFWESGGKATDRNLPQCSAEIRALPGCVVAITYRSFGITYWSHLQGISCNLKKGMISCPEKSVRSHYTMHNNPEERVSSLHRDRSRKSLRVSVILKHPILYDANVRRVYSRATSQCRIKIN
jgi:hypothetical protein